MFEILRHAGSDYDAADPAKEPARADREQNTKWDGFDGVGSLFTVWTLEIFMSLSSRKTWTHLICTAESNPPMVQIGLSQESMNAQPDGQVVRFSTWVKMYEALFRESLAPIGKAMMVAKMSTKFITTKTVWSFPITLAMVDAIAPWQATVAKNVPYICPFVGVQLPSRAMTMTDKN